MSRIPRADTGFLRRIFDYIYRGSGLLAERIINGVIEWIRAGQEEDGRKGIVQRDLVVAGGLLALLFFALRPATVGALGAMLAVATLIVTAALLAPLIAVLLVACLGAVTGPWVMWVVTPLWCWRAYRAAETAALPHLLNQVLGDQPMYLAAAADALNALVGRRAWSPGKLERCLATLDCPPREVEIAPKDGRKKPKTAKALYRSDLAELLAGMRRPPLDTDEAADDDPDGDLDQEPVEQAVVPPLLALSARLIGPARGVHLAALAQRYRRERPGAEITTAKVRSELAALGVPTRSSVRGPKGAVPGAEEGVSEGVHREDLEAVIGPLDSHPPLPGPRDVAGAVATGHDLHKHGSVATAATPVATGVATPHPARDGHFDTGMTIHPRQA